MKYDSDNFQKDVIERSRQIPVLVDFWAEWCGPCKVLGPVLERLAEKYIDRFALVKINTEKHPQLAMEYGIRSIPNVKLFADGEAVNEFVGALPEDMIKRWLDKALPAKQSEGIKQAQELLTAGKLPEARAALEKVLATEPDNLAGAALLGQTLVYEDPPRAVELVRHIEEDSEYFETVETIRSFGRLFQYLEERNGLSEGPVKDQYLAAIRHLHSADFPAALEGFIEVLQTDRYYDEDGPRKACIAIFKFLGEEHEITRKYRPAFSSVLYV
jgi:putative thioredoxin